MDISSQQANFSLGVPSLPFSVSTVGGLKETLGVRYDNLRFSLVNGSTFNLDTSPLNELKVSFDVTPTQNAHLEADMGLFSVTATPLPSFGLHAGIAVDIGANGTMTPSLTGGANVNLALVGMVGSGTPVDNFKLPSIRANMLMDWQLGGANADPTVTKLASFGASAPTLRFQNVQVGLGEYLSDVLSPVTAAIQTYLTYYKPYLELINAKIPGLEDAFQAAGLGDATILHIAKILNDAKVIDDPLFTTVEKYSELISNLQAGFGDLIDSKVPTLPSGATVNLGDFDLAGNGDLRAAQQAAPLAGLGDLTSLVPHATTAVQYLQDKLGSYADLGGVQAFLRTLQSDISISFPFSDNPTRGAFAMLLGQDVPLVEFTVNLPSVFNVDLQQLMNKVGAPVLGTNNLLPATAELGGNLNVDIHLVGGYDTRGLREIIAGRDDGDIGQLVQRLLLRFDRAGPLGQGRPHHLRRPEDRRHGPHPRPGDRRRGRRRGAGRLPLRQPRGRLRRPEPRRRPHLPTLLRPGFRPQPLHRHRQPRRLDLGRRLRQRLGPGPGHEAGRRRPADPHRSRHLHRLHQLRQLEPLPSPQRPRPHRADRHV